MNRVAALDRQKKKKGGKTRRTGWKEFKIKPLASAFGEEAVIESSKHTKKRHKGIHGVTKDIDGNAVDHSRWSSGNSGGVVITTAFMTSSGGRAGKPPSFVEALSVLAIGKTDPATEAEASMKSFALENKKTIDDVMIEWELEEETRAVIACEGEN